VCGCEADSYGVGGVAENAAGAAHQDGVILTHTGRAVLGHCVPAAQRGVLVTAEHAKVATLAEVGAPGVAGQPVFDSFLLSIPNQLHGVVDCPLLHTGDDAGAVGKESAGIETDGHRTQQSHCIHQCSVVIRR